MTWVAYLSLVLVPLCIFDRIAFARRWYWAPIFGLIMQGVWVTYGLALGPDGVGMWIVAVILAFIYGWSIPKWLRHRKKSGI